MRVCEQKLNPWTVFNPLSLSLSSPVHPSSGLYCFFPPSSLASCYWHLHLFPLSSFLALSVSLALRDINWFQVLRYHRAGILLCAFKVIANKRSIHTCAHTHTFMIGCNSFFQINWVLNIYEAFMHSAFCLLKYCYIQFNSNTNGALNIEPN